MPNQYFHKPNNNMEPLQSLYNQKLEYTALKDFVFKHLEALALERIFTSGDGIEGLYQTKIVLQNAFNQIEREYGHKEVKQAVNQSE